MSLGRNRGVSWPKGIGASSTVTSDFQGKLNHRNLGRSGGQSSLIKTNDKTADKTRTCRSGRPTSPAAAPSCSVPEKTGIPMNKLSEQLKGVDARFEDNIASSFNYKEGGCIDAGCQGQHQQV